MLQQVTTLMWQGDVHAARTVFDAMVDHTVRQVLQA